MTDTAQVHCPCRTVELSITGSPTAQFYCHCQDCRTVHGGAYVARAMYPLDSLMVATGEVSTFTLKTTARIRCARCGTQLFAEVASFGVRGLNAYLLPNKTFVPAFHIHCAAAVVPILDRLPHYRGAPRWFGGSDDIVEW